MLHEEKGPKVEISFSTKSAVRKSEVQKLKVMEQSFIAGKENIKARKFEEAVKNYEYLLAKNPSCVEAWNNLGVALCESFLFHKSLEAYNRIDITLRSPLTWYNIALAQYFSSDYDSALESVQASIDGDVLSDKTFAFDLKGRILIEQESYKAAMVSFNQAFTESGKLEYLLLEAYSMHLFLEFSTNVDELTHKKLLNLLIRRLERVEKLSSHVNNRLVHEQALYFLGCCYSRYGDSMTSVGRLEACLQHSSSGIIAVAAKNLLTQVWNFQVRPAWWTWWLQSPIGLYSRAKRLVFCSISTLFIVLMLFFLLHPVLFMSFPKLKSTTEWEVYLSMSALLLAILLFPSIEQIKTKGMEVKMHSPPPLYPFPAAARLEDQIGSMRESKIKNSAGIFGIF